MPLQGFGTVRAVGVHPGPHGGLSIPPPRRRVRHVLLRNTHARALLATARAATISRQQRTAAAEADRHEAAWRERALNAEHALGHAHTEILTQRRRIAELAGQIRDLQQPSSGESARRPAAENTALQQQVHRLTGEHRTLQEHLDAARSTNRFLDRRVADLEAQLAEHIARRI